MVSQLRLAALANLPAGARMAVKRGANRSVVRAVHRSLAETFDGLRSAATSIYLRGEAPWASERYGDSGRELKRRRAYDNRHYVRPAVAHVIAL